MKNNLKQFDVVLVEFGDDVIGSEQGGIRPAVIVQNDTGNVFSPTTLVFPLTTHIKRLHQPTHTLIKKGRGTGLYNNSMVLGEAIRQISEKRIMSHLGTVTDKDERNAIIDVYMANLRG